MFRKVWSTVEVLYSFFARINSGDDSEGIVYVSVLLLYFNSGTNPYPANVENNASRWQMGFNSACKGLMWYLIRIRLFFPKSHYLKNLRDETFSGS
jgi:hypothetical protein